MRPGWQNSADHRLTRPTPGVIGVVIAQKFPEPALIREKLLEGISRVHPGTVWVMRDPKRKGHASEVAYEVFEECEIEPLLAPLTPGWQIKAKPHRVIVTESGCFKRLPEIEGKDWRSSARDNELRATCERIIVFHDKSSGVTAEWVEYANSRRENPGDGPRCLAKVMVVERGKQKPKARKGRKPTGV